MGIDADVGLLDIECLEMPSREDGRILSSVLR